MVTSTRYVTADELLHMSEDGYRYELVRGELRKSMPPGYVHDEYAGNINFSMRSHVLANGLGRVYFEAGFLLGLDHVRAPDTAFVSHERREEIGRRAGYFPGPPDLAVEVISPSNRRDELEEKIADYLEAGTKAVIPSAKPLVSRPDADASVTAGCDSRLDSSRIGGATFAAPASDPAYRADRRRSG